MSILPTEAAPRAALTESRQCLVVTTSAWATSSGIMSIFERDDGNAPWRRTGSTISVRVGRAGLAWGRGVTKTVAFAGPIKKEGDDKAPAGIFRLGPVFGSKRESKMPFVALTNSIVAVDDPRSRYYNRLVDQSTIKRDWRHAEKMAGVDVYRLGVVVEHNVPPYPNAGSCIFLHVWQSPTTSTSGCTAMSEPNLLRIIRWLDPASHPSLIQLPQSAYHDLRQKWNLP